jgi:hypothetical protein
MDNRVRNRPKAADSHVENLWTAPAEIRLLLTPQAFAISQGVDEK